MNTTPPNPCPPSTDRLPELDILEVLQNAAITDLRAALEAASADTLADVIDQLNPATAGFSGVRPRKVTRVASATVCDLGEVDEAPTKPDTSQRLPDSVQEPRGISPGSFVEPAEVNQ